MQKVICYYHKVDLDGKCSAAIVRRKYPNCELIGVDYPDNPDFNKIKPDDTVFVVDFSFQPDDMAALNRESSKDLIWIDHHKSAIKKIEDAGLLHEISGCREIGKAGCELTWKYLFPDEPMPEAVRLLGRYDVWDHSDQRVLPFQYGMRFSKYETWEPDDPAWNTLLSGKAKLWERQIYEKGLVILEYETAQNAKYAKSMAFSVEFDGYEAWAINKALGNSKIFDSLDWKPLLILFSYKKDIWKYSLYSTPMPVELDLAPCDQVDASKIAVKYGGGGHAGAAGFQSDKYLLKEGV